MPSPDSESPEETYFNDLTQQTSETNGGRPSPTRTTSQDAQNDNAAKQKRMACVLCRKRKLRCDGTRPTCGTCKRLSHDCAYDEVRKKSGPKRGYVKLLEQRLRKLMYPSGDVKLLTMDRQNKLRLYSRTRTRPTQTKTQPARTQRPPTSRTPCSKRYLQREHNPRIPSTNHSKTC